MAWLSRPCNRSADKPGEIAIASVAPDYAALKLPEDLEAGVGIEPASTALQAAA